MKKTIIENGFSIIDLDDKNRIYECRCRELNCGEVFYVTNNYSCSPACPSCSKDNTDYVNDNDLVPSEIIYI